MENGLFVSNMQYMRIQEHPLQINENLLVIDNLEGGRLRLFEHIEGPVNIQQLICGNEESCKNAVMIAEIIINDNWQNQSIFIHKIFFEYGYEELIKPMINQVLHFAYFYGGYEAIGISDREFEKCLPYVGEALADFQKSNQVYVYSLNGGKEE